MVYLTLYDSRLCFLFDQASSLQDSELSEKVLLEGCFANLCVPICQVRPHCCMDSQPVGQPPLHSHSLAISPARQAYKPECYGAF